MPTCTIDRVSDEDFDSSWIDRFADEEGVARLTPDQIDALLSLAGRAARDSDDRRNAPMSCFLRGLQLGRAGVTDLDGKL